MPFSEPVSLDEFIGDTRALCANPAECGERQFEGS
jgi:hypothetical protein